MLRLRRARKERSKGRREKRDREARSAATLFRSSFERNHDPFQASGNCLHAAGDYDNAGPIENCETLKPDRLIIPPPACKRRPRSDMKYHHAPRLRHPSAKFALHADGLTEDSHISSKDRKDYRPVTQNRIHPTAVGDTYKDHDV